MITWFSRHIDTLCEFLLKEIRLASLPNCSYGKSDSRMTALVSKLKEYIFIYILEAVPWTFSSLGFFNLSCPQIINSVLPHFLPSFCHGKLTVYNFYTEPHLHTHFAIEHSPNLWHFCSAKSLPVDHIEQKFLPLIKCFLQRRFCVCKA